MKTVREICNSLSHKLPENPICIETGCMYVCDPGNEVHTTTNNILDYIIKPLNGWLYSLDINELHIDFAKEFCYEPNNVEFLLGDSVASLKYLSEDLSLEVNLLCLDSKEFDPDHMVNEYEAIKNNLAPHHFIMVDDINNPNSVKYKKLVPILKDLGYSYQEVDTPTGMFLAQKG